MSPIIEMLYPASHYYKQNAYDKGTFNQVNHYTKPCQQQARLAVPAIKRLVFNFCMQEWIGQKQHYYYLP